MLVSFMDEKSFIDYVDHFLDVGVKEPEFWNWAGHAFKSLICMVIIVVHIILFRLSISLKPWAKRISPHRSPRFERKRTVRNPNFW